MARDDKQGWALFAVTAVLTLAALLLGQTGAAALGCFVLFAYAVSRFSWPPE